MTSTASIPGPQSPEELLQRFNQCLRSGELDGLLALYEPASVFVPPSGARCSGLAAIREALTPFVALAPVMETNVREAHIADDVALVIVDWHMRGTAPDGSAVERRGTSADVMRRQRDGSWRVLIDHP